MYRSYIFFPLLVEFGCYLYFQIVAGGTLGSWRLASVILLAFQWPLENPPLTGSIAALPAALLHLVHLPLLLY